jgi:site-specific DNA-methyltransferase (adenine-specific)
MDELKTNVLYYGDNLEILRKYIPDNFIDLIYLDPPFSSKRDYNIIFKEFTGKEPEAQIKAFEDTWHWDRAAEDAFQDIVLNGPAKVAKLISAIREGIAPKGNDVMAYLVMMTVRLLELRRVLKDTGSFYLHCDPTMSHYIKLMLDQIFGPTHFRSEIMWKRFSGHGNVYRSLGRIHDILLFYSKGDKWIWNQQYRPLSEKYVESFFRYVEPETGRRYRLQNVLNPNKNRPHLTYEWNGHVRVWKWTKEKMQQLHDAGLLVYSKIGLIKGVKQYLDESLGQKIDDVWDDIRPVGQTDDTKLGYETQKPLALLERIIKTSSNEGDIVLDPFCGCGTALVAAQKLNRRWVGIDITHLAINVMKKRLQDSFPGIQLEVIGEPKDFASACELAQQNRYQFQWWALSLVSAKPLGEKKKGADQGIDGVIDFIDDHGDKARRAVVQVKSGHVSVKDIRELKSIAEQNAMGIFITLALPTREMQKEAVATGYYHSPLYGRDYPKIQILTIEELLQGKKVDMPPTTREFFPKAPRISKREGEQIALAEPQI